METRAPFINWFVFALSLALFLKLAESGMAIATTQYWSTFIGGVVIHTLIGIVLWQLLDRIEPGAGRQARRIGVSLNAAALQGATMAVFVAIIGLIIRLIF